MAIRSVSEARATLPELLDRVEDGEEVTITRHGKAVAVLVAPDRHRLLRTAELRRQADELRRGIEAAGKRPLSSFEGISPGRAEELVAQIRRDRDAR
jgi:prevent-host-death family protein